MALVGDQLPTDELADPGKSLNLRASGISSVKWNNGSLMGLLQGQSGISL